MATVFSAALIKARKEAGFPTAYGFYHDNGGASSFKMSYRTYLSVEQGETLPAFEKLHAFLLALRLTLSTPPANKLVISWLQTMAGEKSYDLVLKPLISAATGGRNISPLHEAAKRTLTQKRYNITPEQFRAILTDFDTYLCSVAMTNDTGVWSAEDMAKDLKLKVPAAAKALETLAKAKILKRVDKDHYKCPLTDITMVYPHLGSVDPELRSRLLSYHKQLADSGKQVWSQGITIRADSADFPNFFPLLEQDMETGSSYNTIEKTPTTALYNIESKITKLRDF
ncbi:MAG: hypothetical protein NTY45_11620 [Elusimicrobia bacterium]|nr:hypothetical protein [Elusimicrobiota bacterium]